MKMDNWEKARELDSYLKSKGCPHGCSGEGCPAWILLLKEVRNAVIDGEIELDG